MEKYFLNNEIERIVSEFEQMPTCGPNTEWHHSLINRVNAKEKVKKNYAFVTGILSISCLLIILNIIIILATYPTKQSVQLNNIAHYKLIQKELLITENNINN